jgi:hypothetical protein
MSTAASGRAREHKIRDELTAHGWHLVARSAGSKGAADLVMVHAEYGLALIQVGTDKKSLGPADRNRLLDLADLCSALPIVARCAPRQPTVYTRATRDVPSTWTEWSPS